jgi:hypothetical protein
MVGTTRLRFVALLKIPTEIAGTYRGDGLVELRAGSHRGPHQAHECRRSLTIAAPRTRSSANQTTVKESRFERDAVGHVDTGRAEAPLIRGLRSRGNFPGSH